MTATTRSEQTMKEANRGPDTEFVPGREDGFASGEDDEFAPKQEEREAYARLSSVVRRLRRDCPWDREQTHESVKHLLIEEAYEAVSAIDGEDWDELHEELGDLVLHVLFHGVMGEEGRRFSITDILRRETEKLVRRHPHVFGGLDVEDTDAVLRNWERIKMQERARAGTRRSALEGVPRSLPALLRAYRVQQKAAGVGFDFSHADGAWEKVREEIGEFADSMTSGLSEGDQEREFGDLLFALVNYARFNGINPENALSRTNDRFVRRFRHVEGRLAESGQTMEGSDMKAMDALWEEAKQLEGKVELEGQAELGGRIEADAQVVRGRDDA